MEAFVTACYWLSVGVFCGSLVGFFIWENAAPARYDRRLSRVPSRPQQECATPARLEEVSAVA
jgi:hypothetical protein